MLNTNIALFGDSIGKGVVTDNERLSVISKSAVRLFERKYSVKIDNRSKFGQTLAKSFTRKVFDEYVCNIDKSKENTAVIELGGNDSAYSWEDVACTPGKFHDAVTPLNEFIDYYRKTLALLKANGVKVFCCSLVPISSKRYFDNVIGRICDKSKVLEFFRGDYTTIYRHHEMFSKAITDVCNEYGVPVIDLRSPFLSTFEFSSLLCEDGIHPNERGQEVIFKKVSEFVDSFNG